MKILIVDDEKNIRESLKKFFEIEKIEVILAENGISAKRILEEEIIDAAILDLKMPGMDGIELLKWIDNEGPRVPVIMISAFGEISDAVNAMKLGAKDYIVKPFEPDELLIKIKRTVLEQNLSNKIEIGKNLSKIDFIGENNEIKKIKKLILKISNTTSNVLITGESGTGKEIIARMIHDSSLRKENPFIPINIGGIPENLLESELFGYERGAFTGANDKKAGLFELANFGTLFLDEIGDMPIQLQVKILRVLQDKKTQRLGATQYLPINSRIITATNKNLEKLVKEGKFREDLFFRLNVIRINLPPLRERKEDIPLLVGYFIKKFNKELNRNIKFIDPDALRILEDHPFPGNVRELENIIERSFIYSENDYISKKDIDINIDKKIRNQKRGKIKDLEKELIIESLHKWEGNRTKASKELGFTRRTLFNKIKEYQIDI